LPLLAAVVIAAPGGVVQQFPASTGPLSLAAPVWAAPAFAVRAAAPIAVAQPAVTTFTHHQVAPAVAHVSVPVHKTVHYETKPVVTGYSSTIIKPAIPHFAAPALQAVSVHQHVVAAPAPVHHVAAVAAPVHHVGDATIVEARAAVAPVVHAAPVAVAHHQTVVAAPVALRAAQAGDFGPLVTKEHVLAPVRTHTQITPQITQVQPEVTVRKVIHDVPVATPVAVQSPVHFRVNSPIVAAPALHHGFAGHQFIGHAGHQFVL